MMVPLTPQLPNIFKEADLWTAMGVLGLLLGLVLLVFDWLVFSLVESLIDVAHTGLRTSMDVFEAAEGPRS